MGINATRRGRSGGDRGSAGGGRAGPAAGAARLRRLAAERVYRAVDHWAAEASLSAIEEVLRAPSDVGSGARLFAAAMPQRSVVEALDPMAAAFLRGAFLKEDLVTKSGGALPAAMVADAFGTTRQAIEKRRQRRKLLAVKGSAGDWLFPVFQFTAEGDVLPGLSEVLAAFPDSYDEWMRLSVLVEPSEVFGGRSVSQVLEGGDDTDVRKAVHLIRDLVH